MEPKARNKYLSRSGSLEVRPGLNSVPTWFRFHRVCTGEAGRDEITDYTRRSSQGDVAGRGFDTRRLQLCTSRDVWLRMSRFFVLKAAWRLESWTFSPGVPINYDREIVFPRIYRNIFAFVLEFSKNGRK